MILTLARWINRLFPERQILVRAEGRVSYITLSRRSQIGGVLCLLLAAGGVGYISVGYVHFGKMAAREHAHVTRAELSNADLRLMVTALQTALSNATGELETTQSRLVLVGTQYGSIEGTLSGTEQKLQELTRARDELTAQRDELQKELDALSQQADAKDGYAATLAKTLAQNQTQLEQNEAQKTALAAKLHQLEKDLQLATQRLTDFKSDLESN